MDKPLDILGRELAVGAHVCWGVKGALRHGFVSSIKRLEVRAFNYTSQSYHTKFQWHVTASDGKGHNMGRRSDQFCAIVLPDIQDPEIQLGLVT